MNTRPSPEEIDERFRRYRDTRRRRLRNELVEIHAGLAHHIAKRFHNRGVAQDDLHQIALLALVKAVDRFDPDHGAAFTTFAGRTIEGEIKRHFRDATWAVKVPRSAKELHLAVRRARTDLGQQLGRSPTVPEVAAHLDVDTDAVLRALGAAAAFSSDSLDRPMGDDEGPAQDRRGALIQHDADLEDTVDRVLVERLIDGLDDRSATIVRLRFFEGMTQTEIADEVGVSQMHVSRLLRRALAAMRETASRPAAGPTDPTNR